MSAVINDQTILTVILKNEEVLRMISREMGIDQQDLMDYLEQKMKNDAVAYIDGGARGNPGESGAGVYLKYQNQTEGYYYYLGKGTNNQAEYQALLKAFDLAQKKKISELIIYTDSELMAKQINGLYKVKNEQLKKYYNQAQGFISQLERFSIKHVRREKNKEADQLANMAMDLKKDGKA